MPTGAARPSRTGWSAIAGGSAFAAGVVAGGGAAAVEGQNPPEAPGEADPPGGTGAVAASEDAIVIEPATAADGRGEPDVADVADGADAALGFDGAAVARPDPVGEGERVGPDAPADADDVTGAPMLEAGVGAAADPHAPTRTTTTVARARTDARRCGNVVPAGTSVRGCRTMGERPS
jgi:hypothetical protein